MVRAIRFAPLPDPCRLDADNQLLDLVSTATGASKAVEGSETKLDSVSVTTLRASIDDDDASSISGSPPHATPTKVQTSTSTPSSSTSRSLGSSLRRVLSLGSSKKHKRSRSDSSATRDPSGLIDTLPTHADGKSRKMLNGRVYGGRRHAPSSSMPATNPFANAKAEPEFVEWGYGGMASCRHSEGVGGQVWGKLQSDDTTYSSARGHVGGSRSARRPGNVTPRQQHDSDDGSGMSWVKKRREQREREKREKEARDRGEEQSSDNDHLTKAVNIPFAQSHHHHTEPHHRHQNRDSAVTPEPDSSRTSLVSESDSATSSSSSETLDELDEPAEEDESLRKTSLCAGVEKVTQHRETGRNPSRPPRPAAEHYEAAAFILI